ncbi:MAG: ankyrin repeat domain-containing protein [Deltaproteobacteria bacterium]|nr:ankyrin repeat domain-containing protein [Deltaproteobacteria bacterium]
MKRLNYILGLCLLLILTQGCVTSPLGDAAAKGNLSRVRALISDGADINGTPDEASPLLHASKNNHLKIVKYLINKGASVDKGSRVATPLSAALHHGNIKVANLLLKEEPNLNLTLYNIGFWNVGQTAGIPIIKFSGQKKIIKLLLKRGADLNYQLFGRNNMTAIYSAIEAKNIKLIKHYIKKGADIDILDGDNVSPRELGKESSSQRISDFFEIIE